MYYIFLEDHIYFVIYFDILQHIKHNIFSKSGKTIYFMRISMYAIFAIYKKKRNGA